MATRENYSTMGSENYISYFTILYSSSVMGGGAWGKGC
jgi:hypothetical protein